MTYSCPQSAASDWLRWWRRQITRCRPHTLHVDRLEGTWKMIQHHPETNRLGVIDRLTSTGEPTAMEVANVMSSLEKGQTAR